MCIHPVAMAEADGESVDSACRSMTAPWIRQKRKERNGGSASNMDIENGAVLGAAPSTKNTIGLGRGMF